MSAGAGGGLPPRGAAAACGAPAACAPAAAPRPRAPPGAGAGPSGTIRALVMVALSNLTLVRFSHGVAAAAAPRSTRAMLLIIDGPFGQAPDRARNAMYANRLRSARSASHAPPSGRCGPRGLRLDLGHGRHGRDQP